MGTIRLPQLLGVCFVVVTLLLARPLHADENVIAFVNTDGIPFKWKQDGKFVGPLLDIVQEAQRRTGIDFKAIPMPVNRLFYWVEKGDVLGAIGVTYNTKRLEWAYYVDVPIGWLDSHVFVRKDSKIEVNSIEDLYTLRVAVLAGFHYYSKAYQDAHASGKIVPEEIENYDSLLQFLLLNRADVIISPTVAMETQISKTNATDKVKKLSFPISKIQLFLMISKKASESIAGALVAQKLEAALISMQKEEAIAAIYKKHGYEFFTHRYARQPYR